MVNTGWVKGYWSGTDVSFKAEAAITTNYRPVNLWTASNEVVVAATNTTRVIWFTQNKQATAWQMVSVRTAWYSLAHCSWGWTKGNLLTATTDSALEATTTAGDLICWIAIETVDDWDIGMILIVAPNLRYDSF